jgi:hypothetical protein
VDTFLELIQRAEGLELGQLEPLTTLLVWTWNTLYRVVVAEGSDVFVQGGSHFPEPTPAHIDGASAGGSFLKMGWIGVGLVMELRVRGKRIVTSPVVAIATERPGVPVAH